MKLRKTVLPGGRKPRIIYNDDTCSLRFAPQPHSVESLDTALGYMRETQVDCICWFVVDEISYAYPSKIIESEFDILSANRGDSQWHDGFKVSKNLSWSLYREGIEYLPLLIDRAHRQDLSFVASFRMNDTHHKSTPDSPLTNAFWKEHQHYRLWEITDGLSYFNAALDYSYEEVRRRKLDTVAEVAQNYDVDGIELDFSRKPFFSQPSEAWEKRGILTAFVEEIRDILGCAGEAKGRELSLVVRVPFDGDTLVGGGMDIEAWLKRGLPDILVMTPLSNSYNQSLQPWLNLCRENGVLFHAAIESGTAFNTDYSRLPLSNPLAPRHNHEIAMTPDLKVGLQRAMAQNYLAQGADGVYMFNFPCTLFERESVFYNNRPVADKLTAVLSELGDMETLHGRSKYYMFYEDLPFYVEAGRPAEYQQTSSLLFVYRLHDAQRRFNLLPRKLSSSTLYRVTDFDALTTGEYTGSYLMTEGLEVDLPDMNNAQLIVLTAV